MKIGERIGDRVSIADGLSAGQRVLLDPPKAADDEPKKKKEPEETDKPAEKDDGEAKEAEPKEEASETEEEKKETKEPKQRLVGTWRGRIEGPDPFPPDGLEGALVVEKSDDGGL